MISQACILPHVLGLVVMACSLGIFKSASPPVRVHCQGTVAVVTNDRVMIAARNERRTFVVSKDAVIYVNRAEAPLEEVLPGQYASISGSLQGGQLTADFINAHHQY